MLNFVLGFKSGYKQAGGSGGGLITELKNVFQNKLNGSAISYMAILSFLSL